MAIDIKRILEIIHDLLFIGQTASKDIQFKTDVRKARKIRKFIEERDLEKLRDLILKNQTLLNEGDICGITDDGIVVSPELLIKFGQTFRELRRCLRKGD